MRAGEAINNPVDAEELLRQYALKRTDALRNSIVEAHLYIAAIVARRFSGKGVDYEDLYQVAALALMKVVERFDVDKGVKFVTFAMPSVVGEVKNYFRDRSRIISLPRRGGELLQKMGKARAALEQELMRAPTADELAERLDITLEQTLELMEMQGAASPASFDGADDEDEKSPLDAFLGVDEQGFSRFETNDLVKRALLALDEGDRAVLTQRYFLQRSQREVAETLGVSQMSVSRTERRALTRLREILRDQ